MLLLIFLSKEMIKNGYVDDVPLEYGKKIFIIYFKSYIYYKIFEIK